MDEIWNREELYAEVWEMPLVKVAAKYDISAVALGKVCRKLQIPLPGRAIGRRKNSENQSKSLHCKKQPIFLSSDE